MYVTKQLAHCRNIEADKHFASYKKKLCDFHLLYLSCTMTLVIITFNLALAVYATGILKQESTISSKIHARSETSPRYKVILVHVYQSCHKKVARIFDNNLRHTLFELIGHT